MREFDIEVSGSVKPSLDDLLNASLQPRTRTIAWSLKSEEYEAKQDQYQEKLAVLFDRFPSVLNALLSSKAGDLNITELLSLCEENGLDFDGLRNAFYDLSEVFPETFDTVVLSEEHLFIECKIDMRGVLHLGDEILTIDFPLGYSADDYPDFLVTKHNGNFHLLWTHNDVYEVSCSIYLLMYKFLSDDDSWFCDCVFGVGMEGEELKNHSATHYMLSFLSILIKHQQVFFYQAKLTKDFAIWKARNRECFLLLLKENCFEHPGVQRDIEQFTKQTSPIIENIRDDEGTQRDVLEERLYELCIPAEELIKCVENS